MRWPRKEPSSVHCGRSVLQVQLPNGKSASSHRTKLMHARCTPIHSYEVNTRRRDKGGCSDGILRDLSSPEQSRGTMVRRLIRCETVSSRSCLRLFAIALASVSETGILAIVDLLLMLHKRRRSINRNFLSCHQRGPWALHVTLGELGGKVGCVKNLRSSSQEVSPLILARIEHLQAL